MHSKLFQVFLLVSTVVTMPFYALCMDESDQNHALLSQHHKKRPYHRTMAQDRGIGITQSSSSSTAAVSLSSWQSSDVSTQTVSQYVFVPKTPTDYNQIVATIADELYVARLITEYGKSTIQMLAGNYGLFISAEQQKGLFQLFGQSIPLSYQTALAEVMIQRNIHFN